jgi:hypothetical protein
MHFRSSSYVGRWGGIALSVDVVKGTCVCVCVCVCVCLVSSSSSSSSSGGSV